MGGWVVGGRVGFVCISSYWLVGWLGGWVGGGSSGGWVGGHVGWWVWWYTHTPFPHPHTTTTYTPPTPTPRTSPSPPPPPTRPPHLPARPPTTLQCNERCVVWLRFIVHRGDVGGWCWLRCLLWNRVLSFPTRYIPNYTRCGHPDPTVHPDPHVGMGCSRSRVAQYIA